MNNTLFTRNVLVAVLTLPCVPLAQALETRLVSPVYIRQAVAVEVDRADGSVISGRVINKTSHRIKDPELSIRYDWIWQNEYEPGENNPGWATRYVLPAELDANESAEFIFEPERPLPQRTDGHIIPSVAVMGYTQYKMPAEK